MGTDAELVGIEVKGEESQDRGVSGDEFTDEFGGEFFEPIVLKLRHCITAAAITHDAEQSGTTSQPDLIV